MTAKMDWSSSELSALFDLDIDGVPKAEEVDALLCTKCNGRGTFIGFPGKTVGKCFACDGSGLQRHAGVELKPGDCAKCMGSGEYSSGRPCFACKGTGHDNAASSAAINVGAIETAFEAARANGIKRPRLRLADFTFSRAPDTGKNAGSIYVKQGEDYLGKITAGLFHPTMACDAATSATVIEVASEPHNVAKAFGMRTGSCSCCGRELTNKESIDLGIGPICREKFGW